MMMIMIMTIIIIIIIIIMTLLLLLLIINVLTRMLVSSVEQHVFLDYYLQNEFYFFNILFSFNLWYLIFWPKMFTL